MKSFSYQDMSDFLQQHFKIQITQSDAEKLFSSSIPFSRFLAYVRKMNQLSDGPNFLSSSDIWELVNSFEFDRELRAIFMRAILRIEDGIRTTVFEAGHEYYVNYISPGNPDDASWWYLDAGVYNRGFDMHKNCFDQIRKKIDENADWKSNPKSAPFSWDMAISPHFGFGSLNILFSNLSSQLLINIGYKFMAKYPDSNIIPGTVLHKWTSKIADLRNSCGHNDFIWVHDPLKGEIYSPPSIRSTGLRKESLCAYAMAIYRLLYATCHNKHNSIIPGEFKQDLLDIFSKADTSWGKNIDFRAAMGFDKNWESSTLWL